MSRHDPNRILLRRLSLLWSWDEDEDNDDDDEPLSSTNSTHQTQYSTPRAPDPTLSGSRNIELIDLVSPDISPQGLKQAPYQPKTLASHDQQRRQILPMFPVNDRSASTEPMLLLANVPMARLSVQQGTCRRTGQYLPSFSILMATPASESLMKEKYDFFFGDLLQRMKVDMRIIDYNYTRMKYLLQLFAQSRIRILNAQRSPSSPSEIKEDEYPKLLEFYLQIDVDLFFMKTCSFRGAQPRTVQEGLFCDQEPECRYTMVPCGHCDLCRPTNVTMSRQRSAVQFNLYERHRFVNGYESILNAPATCSTTNMIYVLTCPCDRFDYIGESSQTLGQCLRRHRQFGHRLIHEFLIGEQNRQRVQGIQQNSEMASKSRMRLYQHSIRCATALRLFLDWNPQYLCFVPMLKEDALRQNQSTIGNLRSDSNRAIQERLKFVPVPPDGYQFSRRQCLKQYEFFANHIDRQAPNPALNLYQGKIIALLPLESSESFRQIVHALFVTHTESKLNTMGHLFTSSIHTSIHDGVWCENLNRLRQSTTISSRFS